MNGGSKTCHIESNQLDHARQFVIFSAAYIKQWSVEKAPTLLPYVVKLSKKLD